MVYDDHDPKAESYTATYANMRREYIKVTNFRSLIQVHLPSSSRPIPEIVHGPQEPALR